MRNLRLLALVAPALLLPALACEDPTSSSGAAFNPEAGPGFEAGPAPEAGPLPVPEAGTDAAPVPKGVTVTVLEGGIGKKDVRVILHDATGAVSGATKTDASGKVTLATAPSALTVLSTRAGQLTGSSGPAALTFFAVEDGDNLIATLPGTTPVVDPVPIGSYSVAFTAPSVNAPNVFVEVGRGNCSGSGDGTTPVSVPLYAECVAAQNAVLATASNGAGAQEFAFAKNVAKPGAGLTVNVPGLTFAAPGTTKLLSSLVPAGVNYYSGFYLLANGASFVAQGGGGLLDEGGLVFNTPTGFADGYQSLVALRSVASFRSTTAFLRREAAPAGGAPDPYTLPTFDLTKALPFVTAATATVSAAAGRPDITTTAAAPLTATDGGVITMYWNLAVGGEGSWTFVVPPSSTSFKVPALPADAASFVPADTAFVDEVTVLEATQLPGYTQLKALPISPTNGTVPVDITDAAKPLPAAGTVRLTHWLSGQRG